VALSEHQRITWQRVALTDNAAKPAVVVGVGIRRWMLMRIRKGHTAVLASQL